MEYDFNTNLYKVKDIVEHFQNVTNEIYKVSKHEAAKETIPISSSSPDGSILLDQHLSKFQQ